MATWLIMGNIIYILIRIISRISASHTPKIEEKNIFKSYRVIRDKITNRLGPYRMIQRNYCCSKIILFQ